ncbi:hypothetical protein JTB14_033954 [Gonioctena quinquepunctata]|nr:hypothetical protein JTB14_033954 [Gonioctena quinquepunctata]
MYDLVENKSASYIIGEDKPEVWKVEPSTAAKNCRNFIREIVDNLDLKPNPEKPVIALSIEFNESERHEEMDEHDMTALVVLNDDECILASTERVANSKDVDSSKATKKKFSCSTL